MEQARASYRPENDPRAQAKAQHSLYRATRDRALDAIGRHRVLRFRFLNALARLRRFAWWREEMRNYSTWLYALLRTWSLEAGRRLARAGLLSDPEEIWTVSYADVLAALGGEVAYDVLRRKARAGRRLMESFRCFEIPNEIGQGRCFDGPLDSTTVPEVVLRGTPCSSGRAVGRARSIASLEEAGAVRDGDLLVTPFTDPGWTLLFPRLAGVVTETGGLLSHAAVISREYGIPAVLGVTGATRRIGDGDWIAVDGTRGVVEILRRCGT
jgi:pyruvate,water dikinase